MRRKLPRPLVSIVVGLLVFILLILIFGCTPTTKLVTEVRTVEKPVPVISKCIKAADVPVVPRTNFIKGGNIESNAAAASADLRELALYADKADAALQRCAAP